LPNASGTWPEINILKPISNYLSRFTIIDERTNNIQDMYARNMYRAFNNTTLTYTIDELLN
jgi:hypothetical protein